MNYLTFLKRIKPFSGLPKNVIKEVAGLLSDKFIEVDTFVYHQDITGLTGIDIIVEGQYDAYYYNSEQVKVLEENYTPGMIYGGGSILLNKRYSIRTVIARKGTRILSLNKDEFKALCRSYEDFFHFFTTQFGQKVLNDNYANFVKRNSIRDENFLDADKIYTRKVKTIAPRSLVVCTPETTVRDASRIMKEKKVKCVYIKEDGKFTGYITKSVLADKVLATGGNSEQPVINIMEPTVLETNSEEFVYEALLKLYHSQTEYILVADDEQYIGILSRYRLLTENAQSPLVFIQSVLLAHTDSELKEKWSQVPEIINQLLGRGVNAEIVNQIVSTISDTILHRVIEETLDDLPPVPAKFAFIVLGSEGRKEQTLVTDQDNAIIYEDKANEHREEVRAYFLNFAEIVSRRLDTIGFSYCTGGYMAKNPKWTHSLSHWKRNYDEWIHIAAHDTVINITTFFDCRLIYGEPTLLSGLQDHLDSAGVENHQRFLYNMADNALQYEPPLTFFKGIKTFTREEKKVFDLKKAMTPIVDLVRMYALRYHIRETNTGERMKQLLKKGCFSAREYQELNQAYYYLMRIRLNNQARNYIHDFKEPDNFIETEKLTTVEQATLIEIFKVIKEFQSRIKVEFKNELFG